MINVIGLGYIGLPTALMFAAHGNKVIGTDYNETLVHELQHNKLSFEEDGLKELFDKAICENNIEFTTKYISSDVYIIAVPTPYDKVSKKVDAKYIISAIKSIINICPPPMPLLSLNLLFPQVLLINLSDPLLLTILQI